MTTINARRRYVRVRRLPQPIAYLIDLFEVYLCNGMDLRAL